MPAGSKDPALDKTRVTGDRTERICLQASIALISAMPGVAALHCPGPLGEARAADSGGSRNVGPERYRAAVSEAYSVYWPQPRWRRAAAMCQRLAVLFGGPHRSEPSFRRATVQPGDLLYPIGVCDQVLYVLGRMRVREIVPVGDDQALLEEYFARYGAWRFLAPTCTTEVVIGSEGTGIALDRPLPGEILRRLTYQPRRGPRPVRHVSADGRLVHSLSVQGIYRLAGSSAADLEAVLAGPPGQPIPLTRSRRHQAIPPAGMDTLF